MSDRASSWQWWLSKWERSRLTQAEFCRRHGFKVVNFAWCKRKLSARAGAMARSQGGQRGRRGAKRRSSTQFVEVGLSVLVNPFSS